MGWSFAADKLESTLEEARRVLRASKSYYKDEISQATSDVTELLKLGQHKEAYDTVVTVVNKQSDHELYIPIIGYLDLLLDRIHDLSKHDRDFPQELLEAVSSLLFAAPRLRLACSCFSTGLQKVRDLLLSRFGRSLAVQYIERNNCGINPEIIQKLSTRRPTREARMKVLMEIAAKENIVLKLEKASTSTKGTSDVSKAEIASEERVEDERGEGSLLSDSVKKGKKNQKDVACTSRRGAIGSCSSAVVELPQFSPRGPDNNIGRGNSSNGPENKKSKQEQEGNDDYLVKRGKKKQKDVADAEQAHVEPAAHAATGVVRVAKRGKKKQKDVADAEQAHVEPAAYAATGVVRVEHPQFSPRGPDTYIGGGNSSNGPENKKSEQDFIDDEYIKKWLEKDVVIYDSEDETRYEVKTNTTTTKVKDEQDLMHGSNRADTGHVDHIGLKGSVSVRTRRVLE